MKIQRAIEKSYDLYLLADKCQDIVDSQKCQDIVDCLFGIRRAMLSSDQEREKYWIVFGFSHIAQWPIGIPV